MMEEGWGGIGEGGMVGQGGRLRREWKGEKESREGGKWSEGWPVWRGEGRESDVGMER